MVKIFWSIIISFFWAPSELLASPVLVEHQVRLCDSAHSILSKLKSLDIGSAKPMEIYYLETPSLEYQKNKWSIRFRKKEKRTEITLKKRLPLGQKPAAIDGVVCEYDRHGKTMGYTCKIDADIEHAVFLKILTRNTDWFDTLNSKQKSFLQFYGGRIQNSFIFGTLYSLRFKWIQDDLGEIVLDLVHLKNNESYSFHEISLRYTQSDAATKSIKFESFLRNLSLNQCPNQEDWPVNKFDLFDILN